MNALIRRTVLVLAVLALAFFLTVGDASVAKAQCWGGSYWTPGCGSYYGPSYGSSWGSYPGCSGLYRPLIYPSYGGYWGGCR